MLWYDIGSERRSKSENGFILLIWKDCQLGRELYGFASQVKEVFYENPRIQSGILFYQFLQEISMHAGSSLDDDDGYNVQVGVKLLMLVISEILALINKP